MNAHFDYKLFGLEPRDIALYEAMIAHEQPASIRSLAASTRLNRGVVFESIKKLVGLGLATAHFKNKRKYYVAQSPEALQQHANHRHAQVTEQLARVEAYVAHLHHTKRVASETQFTQYYDGELEVAALLRDVLTTTAKLEHKTYSVISSAEVRNHIYGKFRNFTSQRIKRGIFARVIAVGQGGEQAPLSERRWLTLGKAPACYIIIYADKVAQLSFSELGSIQGVVVQNPGVAHLQQLIFEHLWATLA